jgi:hypothetical protein
MRHLCFLPNQNIKYLFGRTHRSTQRVRYQGLSINDPWRHFARPQKVRSGEPEAREGLFSHHEEMRGRKPVDTLHIYKHIYKHIYIYIYRIKHSLYTRLS